MRSSICAAALLVVATLVTGCSRGVPFTPTALVPTAAATAGELSGGVWDAGNGVYLLRHSALFAFRGMELPVTGVMKLDCGTRTARLVGLNDMGVKLFDIGVGPDTSEEIFLIPELKQYPSFVDAVATSVRRIFIAPLPRPGDTLTITADSYLLTRHEGKEAYRFRFGGKGRQLLEKAADGPGGTWRVGYYEHEPDRLIPMGIVLEDDGAGYRLTLWMESVEKTDD